MPASPLIVTLVSGLSLALASSSFAWQEQLEAPVAAAVDREAETLLDRAVAPLVRHDRRVVNAHRVDSAASCAATACHGGPRPATTNPAASRGSEYPLWLERDPHASAWRTLCNGQSVTMLERLNIMQHGKIVDPAGFDNCMACHNSTRRFDEPRQSEPLLEGVGCNACHGPSEQWRTTHFQGSWQPNAAANESFVATKDMLTRARMCASCHVGDHDRDVNHDLIAAGHPPLDYEFTAYHQRLPKHWRERGAEVHPNYQSTQWLAGQVAALDASLALLESRASKRLSVSQWPELASFDCASCHRQLRPAVARAVDDDAARNSAGKTAGKRLGLPAPSRWNRFGVEALLQLRADEGSSVESDACLRSRLDEVNRVLSGPHQLRPTEAISAARSARAALDDWLKSQAGQTELRSGFSADRLRKLAIFAGEQPQNAQSWETSAQLYLASVSARSAWPVAAEARALATARSLRSALAVRHASTAIEHTRQLDSELHDLSWYDLMLDHVQSLKTKASAESGKNSARAAPPLTGQ